MNRAEKEEFILKLLGDYRLPKSQVPDLAKIGGIESLLMQKTLPGHPDPESRPNLPNSKYPNPKEISQPFRDQAVAYLRFWSDPYGIKWSHNLTWTTYAALIKYCEAKSR